MFNELLHQIHCCTVCEAFLPLGANPLVQAHPKAKIIIIGQAPGLKAHKAKLLWDDASGDQLRSWLQVSKAQFYNPELFALIPMGFCYPGHGKSGDLPPRKECAPLWHARLLSELKEAKVILLIGQYAQNYYLKDLDHSTLTDNIKAYKSFLPHYFPLPHPSPRNFFWHNKNPWFKNLVLPELKNMIATIL